MKTRRVTSSTEEAASLVALETGVDVAITTWVDGRPVAVKEFEIMVEWTPANRGGRRAWFVCPVTECQRRVRFLYLVGGRLMLACRQCARLRYKSQVLTGAADERRRARAHEIRAQLAPPTGTSLYQRRPKGMHRTTFERLQAELWELEEPDRRYDPTRVREALLQALETRYEELFGRPLRPKG